MTGTAWVVAALALVVAATVVFVTLLLAEDTTGEPDRPVTLRFVFVACGLAAVAFGVATILPTVVVG